MLWFLVQRVQNDKNFIKAELTVLSRLIHITPAKSAIAGLSLCLQLDIKCLTKKSGLLFFFFSFNYYF